MMVYFSTFQTVEYFIIFSSFPNILRKTICGPLNETRHHFPNSPGLINGGSAYLAGGAGVEQVAERRHHIMVGAAL
jgi:hypothetical protein